MLKSDNVVVLVQRICIGSEVSKIDNSHCSVLKFEYLLNVNVDSLATQNHMGRKYSKVN